MLGSFIKKTFSDSIIFQTNAQAYNKGLVEFILKSERIDKYSDAFRGIIEETKRYQNTAVLFDVLMNPDVVLCIGIKELPAAFKTFESKDIATDKSSKIFIDCTGIMKLNNTYYYCKKIDVFFTYLYCALNILMYRENPIKYLSNSSVSQSATEAFVDLCDSILDYQRFIGYRQSREKIKYLFGLYFMNYLMGKDIDAYTRNTCANIAGISTADTKAFELYYDEEKDFKNITSFITMIADTFKLQGLNMEAFVGQWLYRLGKGTEFGLELFTSFANILITAYCGSYLNNQKTIEKYAGQAMVKFVVAMTQVGSSIIERKSIYEGVDNVPRNKEVDRLIEADVIRKSGAVDSIIQPNIYESLKEAKEQVHTLVTLAEHSNCTDKIAINMNKALKYTLDAVAEGIENHVDNTEALPYITEEFVKYCDVNANVKEAFDQLTGICDLYASEANPGDTVHSGIYIKLLEAKRLL